MRSTHDFKTESVGCRENECPIVMLIHISRSNVFFRILVVVFHNQTRSPERTKCNGLISFLNELFIAIYICFLEQDIFYGSAALFIIWGKQPFR